MNNRVTGDRELPLRYPSRRALRARLEAARKQKRTSFSAIPRSNRPVSTKSLFLRERSLLGRVCTSSGNASSLFLLAFLPGSCNPVRGSVPELGLDFTTLKKQ